MGKKRGHLSELWRETNQSVYQTHLLRGELFAARAFTHPYMIKS
jgi:hypothetical protein